MAFKMRRASYYYATVKDMPGESYRILAELSEIGVNLLAFNAIPTGPNSTQLTLFAQDSDELVENSSKVGIQLDGPHHAILVQGDDELGALANIHMKLYQANVNIYASTGVSDGNDSFGYVIYVRPEDFHKAVEALQLD